MKIYIKYMVSLRCKMMVKEVLNKNGTKFSQVDLVSVQLDEELKPLEKEKLRVALTRSGFELLDDKKSILIEKIKNVVVEMIHYKEQPPKYNYSDYISEKLHYDYMYLSNVFSDVKGITLQQYIIVHKIEKVKELLLYDELNLTEISRKMHYSSVSHLSNQFRKITGLSPSYYKRLKQKRMDGLENF